MKEEEAMARAKTKKSGSKARLKSLPAKSLGVKHAVSVKGGGKSSTSLMQVCATGSHIKKVVIE
jgi:hypothetical protein